MAKQITPQEVITKMAQTINIQKEKGYKIGWCSYQIKEWQYENMAGLLWLDTNLSHEIMRAARGKVKSEHLLENWNDSYEMYAEMEAAYG